MHFSFALIKYYLICHKQISKTILRLFENFVQKKYANIFKYLLSLKVGNGFKFMNIKIKLTI